MKIAIDVRMLSMEIYRTRGVGRYVRELVCALTQIDSNNEYALISASNESPLPQIKSIYNYGEVPVYSKRGIVEQHIRLPLNLQKIPANLIHFPHAYQAPCIRPLGKKMVITVHDLIPYLENNGSQPSIRKRVDDALYREIIGSASAIIAVSNFTANQIRQFTGRSSLPIYVIYEGVNPNSFFPINKKQACSFVADRFHIEKPFLLYTGGFDQRKQVKHLVQMFYQLVNENRLPHVLVLSGRMEAYPAFIEIVREIAKLKIYDRVIFTDYVSDEELVNLYSAADAFAFPSSAEGFGLPVLEAFACETPVIAFNNSSIPEVMGDSGLMVENGDWDSFAHGLLQLITGNFAPQISARNRAAEFSWTHTARKVVDLYQGIM